MPAIPIRRRCCLLCHALRRSVALKKSALEVMCLLRFTRPAVAISILAVRTPRYAARKNIQLLLACHHLIPFTVFFTMMSRCFLRKRSGDSNTLFSFLSSASGRPFFDSPDGIELKVMLGIRLCAPILNPI